MHTYPAMGVVYAAYTSNSTHEESTFTDKDYPSTQSLKVIL